MKLVLENHDGKAVRTFLVEGDEAHLIQRKDTRRLEVHTQLEALEAAKTKFDRLAELKFSEIASAPFEIKDIGRIRVAHEQDAIMRDEDLEGDSPRTMYISLASMILLMISFFSFILNRPGADAKLEQKIKQELVQIVKHIPLKPKKVVEATPTVQQEQPVVQHQVKPTKQATIKRMGALSVLGSLNSGKQKGGVNLGAVNTTAGPGLGGTQGSGGTQTTLYGKGLVAAPVGAGSNMQGGGGYGTKGKGGGQAGYGKLSLVGSAGTAAIPLGREALIEGGLDRDLIADVINRNMGQVRFCYEQALQGDPALAGRVAVAFTIGGNGQVKVADVGNTTLNSKMVEDCIITRLKSWKFPLPQGGVDVKVSYPFVLRRSGQG